MDIFFFNLIYKYIIYETKENNKKTYIFIEIIFFT